MGGVLTEFIQILTGGVTSMATSIGSGLSAMAKAAFLSEGTGGVLGLSTFGGILAIFAGVGLSVSLTTLVTKWVMSLGARN